MSDTPRVAYTAESRDRIIRGMLLGWADNGAEVLPMTVNGEPAGEVMLAPADASESMPPFTVWVTTLDTRHGTDTWVSLTEETAMSFIDAYVAEWWDREVCDGDLPDDLIEARSQYFDQIDGEYFSVEQHALLS